MPPFLNLSNHPSGDWVASQMDAALRLGNNIFDLQFPAVPADVGIEAIGGIAAEVLERVPQGVRVAMVAGEPTLTVALVAALQARGVRCVAACSERRRETGPGGTTREAFHFVRFREFPMLRVMIGSDVAVPIFVETAEATPVVAEALVPQSPPPLAPVVALGAAPTPSPTPPSRRELLNACRWAGRDGSPAAVVRAKREFLEAFPGQEGRATEAVGEGESEARALLRLDEVLWRDGPGSASAQALATEIVRVHPKIERHVQKQFAFVRAKLAERKERALIRAEGRPLTSVLARGEHRVDLLQPAAGWTLWIDETGNQFDNNGPLKGRVVGLVVPDGVALPRLPPDFHATTESFAAIDAAVQGVLDAPVGVFGVALDALGPAPGERWSDTVLEVVAWVARLLPMPESGPVSLTVKIEQRGTFTPEASWVLGVRNVVTRLAGLAPKRAERLDIRITTVAKDGTTPLGQADALAFTWGSPGQESVARFSASDLKDACCIDLPPRLLRSAWEAWEGARPPDGDAWRALIAAAGNGHERTLLGRLLEDLARRTQAEPTWWAGWVAVTAAHLDSKAIDLRVLGLEVDWLQSSAPDGTTVPARLQLCWAVARLATANHRGALDEDGLSATIDALSHQLFDEDARLVCLADLHRAVLATNRLDVTGAKEALSRWVDAPVALPGLQYWGRLRSSVGQHHALRGQNSEARACFAEALAAFDRLSDAAEGRQERSQTGAYLAIAAMDDAGIGYVDSRAHLELVVGPLTEAIPRLSGSTAPADKYPQHLVLRWLMVRGTASDVEGCVMLRRAWRLGVGHPWPLIGFYRALLLHRVAGPGAQVDVLRLANEAVMAANTPSSGWAVRLIGATIATAATALGRPFPEADAHFGDLRTHLPLANVDALAAFLADPDEPAALLARVLPFNFR